MPPSPQTSKPPFNIYWKRICHQRFSLTPLAPLYAISTYAWCEGILSVGRPKSHEFLLFKIKLFSLLLPSKINKKLNNKVLNSFYRFVPNQTCTFFVLFQLFFFSLNKCCCRKKKHTFILLWIYSILVFLFALAACHDLLCSTSYNFFFFTKRWEIEKKNRPYATRIISYYICQ